MNIMFLTLAKIGTLDERGIYQDLLNELIRRGHYVAVISPLETREQSESYFVEGDSYRLLRTKIGNTQKTHLLEKGISTLTLEQKYTNAIVKYFPEKYDLVLYSTPPVTLVRAIRFIKKRDHAKTYLMLKDIFPQNALDLGMLKTTGLKGLAYRYFKWKERQLYQVSDYIGCMSFKNKEYLLGHNRYLSSDKVEVFPNCFQMLPKRNVLENGASLRKKYYIRKDAVVFLFGGNIGIPQGIDFLVKVLERINNMEGLFFLIVGSGTESYRVEEFIEQHRPRNIAYLKQLPRNDYEAMVDVCDVGIVLLDTRFTIPNFPSRVLSYMSVAKPVLAATDACTDLKDAILEGQFGLWSLAGDIEGFINNVNTLKNDPALRHQMGRNARCFMEEHYDIAKNVHIILNHFQDTEER